MPRKKRLLIFEKMYDDGYYEVDQSQIQVIGKKLEAMLHEDNLFFTCAKENYPAMSNLVLYERQMRVSRQHRFFRNTKRPLSPF